MSEAFGPQPVAVVRAPGPRAAAVEMELVRVNVAALTNGGGAALDIAQPRPTAAFSRRDALLPGYDEAVETVATRGFAPVVRPVGGHLAAYGEGSLVLHLWAPHPDPRAHIRARFELFGAAMTSALRGLGVDARLGPVPGEYCDGEFSVNASGSAKLIGTGQRITRAGYLFSALVMVHDAAPAREALTSAYAALGLDFAPETVGCVADHAPGVTLDVVREQLVAALADLLSRGTTSEHEPVRALATLSR